MTNPYVPLLIMAAVALAVAVGGLGASAILGPKQKNRVMAQNYECGIDPGPQHIEDGRFPVIRAAVPIDAILERVVADYEPSMLDDYERIFIQDLNYFTNIRPNRARGR